MGLFNFVGSTPVELGLDSSIIFNSQLMASNNTSASISANFIQIGSVLNTEINNLVFEPSSGLSSLSFNANLIDVVGASSFQNINEVTISSLGDIRFIGVDDTVEGELDLDGNLNLIANRIYPSTNTSFKINAGNAGTIITQNINSDPVISPLSAAGNITFSASNIEHGGNILAPIGSIAFNANENLTLTDDSLLSVSTADSDILFGLVLNGESWVYSPDGEVFEGLDSTDPNNVQNVQDIFSGESQNTPVKEISLNGKVVNLEQGSEVDISGGGNIRTWEFIPGPGGTNDNLLGKNAADLFAIVPSLGSGFGPYDTQVFQGWDLEVGESIYLGAGNGLAEGNYIKLPARYALLPGAYLIEAIDGFDNISINQNIEVLNGTLVGGYVNYAGTDTRESTTSGFIIRDGEYANQLSEYVFKDWRRNCIQNCNRKRFSYSSFDSRCGGAKYTR